MAYVKVARVGDVPPGQTLIVETEDDDIVLCNVDGQLYAVANVCTHDEGPLGQGLLAGYEIECPRHGARFDVRTGAVKALPAVVPIPTYDLVIDGEDVLVEVES